MSLGSLLGASWGLLATKTGGIGFWGSTWGRLGGHVGLIFGPSWGDVPSFSHLILRCPHVKKPQESLCEMHFQAFIDSLELSDLSDLSALSALSDLSALT